MLETNKHLVVAYQEYMQARMMVRQGLINSCHLQRERLRHIYRILANK